MPSCKVIILAAVVFTSLFSKGSCILCYYCTSANNSACLDTNLYEDEVRARIVPVVDCEIAIPSNVKIPFFCRKINQIIFHDNREPEVRVTRGCGWIHNERPDRPCYRNDNHDHYETVCQCFTDHCNSADSTSPTTGVALFVVLAAVLYFY